MEELNKTIIKLTEEELNFVKVREEILMRKRIELQLLTNEKDMFISSLLRKYKLDEKKTYLIKENGEIEEKLEDKK
jgi:hypothetical protein